MRPIHGQECPQGVEEHFGVEFSETVRNDVALNQEVPVISDAASVERGNGVLLWSVTGTIGENRIRAGGPTKDAASWAAEGQAATVVD